MDTSPVQNPKCNPFFLFPPRAPTWVLNCRAVLPGRSRNTALPSPLSGPDPHPPWPCSITMGLHGGHFSFLSILGSPGRPRWTSACSSGLPPAPAVPHRELLWPAGRCGAQPGPQPRRGPQVWRPSAPSLPIRGTDPEVRRAAPEVHKGGWSGFTSPKSEAGAPKGQPFDSLGPSPDPNPLPLPNSQHPVPSGFHLSPCPKACDPWA